MNRDMMEEFPDGGGLFFCQRPHAPRPPNDPAFCPSGMDNDDGYTLTIEVVAYDKELGINPCLEGIACVKGEDTEAIKADEDGHLGNLRMIIEVDTQYTTRNMTWDVIWTNDADAHGQILRVELEDGSEKTGKGVHLPSIITHEFPHAAGFDDLDPHQYPDCLMSYNTDNMGQALDYIPDCDINYAGLVYPD